MGFFEGRTIVALALLLLLLACVAEAWTGEIRGRVVCDVCGDSSIGPEDHALEGESAPFSFSFLLNLYCFCLHDDKYRFFACNLVRYLANPLIIDDNGNDQYAYFPVVAR